MEIKKKADGEFEVFGEDELIDFLKEKFNYSGYIPLRIDRFDMIRLEGNGRYIRASKKSRHSLGGGTYWRSGEGTLDLGKT